MSLPVRNFVRKKWFSGEQGLRLRILHVKYLSSQTVLDINRLKEISIVQTKVCLRLSKSVSAFNYHFLNSFNTKKLPFLCFRVFLWRLKINSLKNNIKKPLTFSYIIVHQIATINEDTKLFLAILRVPCAIQPPCWALFKQTLAWR